MEDKTYGTLVTDCGIQLIAAAVMEGKKINITDLAVGDGGGSYYKPNSTMTALKGEKWRGKVNRVEINEKSPNMIDVVAVIPSDVGGWTIREMGVLDETETLIAVCNTPDTEKVIISSGAAGEIELTMHIEISNADAISFIIDPNVVTATKKDIADHDASKTAHAAEFEKKADVTDLNAHANNTDIHVNPSTMGNYDTAISGLIEHKEDTKIHVTAEEKASWTEGAEQAAADANRVTEALNAIAGIESRVSRVEDGLFNNITGNPLADRSKGETEMNVLTFLAKNWDSVLVVVAFLAVVVVLIKRGETKILKQILFNLVTQAEKQFGSGTGSLKYAAVADWIYQRIPAVLKLLFTSSDIEKMIEAALEEAKKAWGANENLKGYIDTPSVESLLVGIEEQAVQTEPAEN